MDRAIANRYVAALAEIVTRPECALSPESALEQLETFGELLSSSPELEGVLSSPVVKPEDKRALIRDIGSRAGLDALLVNFLGASGTSPSLWTSTGRGSIGTWEGSP